MEEIDKKYIFQKNREKTHLFFKQNFDINQMQKNFVDTCLCYNHRYFTRLSANSDKDNLQLISGRTKESYSTPQANSSKNSDSQFVTTFSNCKDPTPVVKQKKPIKDDIFLDFNNVCFTNYTLFKNLPKFGRITILSLQNCCLTAIPKELHSLPKDLVSLDLSHNYLSKIHPNCAWKKLKSLNLGSNWIHEWPIIFERDKFETLEYLNLTQNFIETSKIAPNAACFKNLKCLIFSDNLLNSFPQWINQCTELVALSLSGNRWIKDIDLSSLLNLPKLNFLDISSIRSNNEQAPPSRSIKMIFADASFFRNSSNSNRNSLGKKK